MKTSKTKANPPLYSKVLDGILTMIEDGTYKIGDRLPSEEELAEHFGVSRPTVRRASGYLEAQGVILRRQGIGTFVSWPSKTSFLGQLERLEPIRKMAEKAGLEAHRIEQEVSLITATDELAKAMSVSTGDEIISNKIVEAVNGIATFYFVNYAKLDSSALEEIRNSGKSQIEYMLENSDYTYTLAELLSIGADEDVARKLQVQVGTPVFHMIETHYTSTGEIIGISYVYSITEKFRFYVIRRPIN